MYNTGISTSDTMKLESVREEDLSVKELEVSTAPYANAQHVSNSGKDRFTVSCIKMLPIYVTI